MRRKERYQYLDEAAKALAATSVLYSISQYPRVRNKLTRTYFKNMYGDSKNQRADYKKFTHKVSSKRGRLMRSANPKKRISAVIKDIKSMNPFHPKRYSSLTKLEAVPFKKANLRSFAKIGGRGLALGSLGLAGYVSAVPISRKIQRKKINVGESIKENIESLAYLSGSAALSLIGLRGFKVFKNAKRIGHYRKVVR